MVSIADKLEFRQSINYAMEIGKKAILYFYEVEMHIEDLQKPTNISYQIQKNLYSLKWIEICSYSSEIKVELKNFSTAYVILLLFVNMLLLLMFIFVVRQRTLQNRHDSLIHIHWTCKHHGYIEWSSVSVVADSHRQFCIPGLRHTQKTQNAQNRTPMLCYEPPKCDQCRLSVICFLNRALERVSTKSAIQTTDGYYYIKHNLDRTLYESSLSSHISTQKYTNTQTLCISRRIDAVRCSSSLLLIHASMSYFLPFGNELLCYFVFVH